MPKMPDDGGDESGLMTIAGGSKSVASPDAVDTTIQASESGRRGGIKIHQDPSKSIVFPSESQRDAFDECSGEVPGKEKGKWRWYGMALTKAWCGKVEERRKASRGRKRC